jgi:hypothetical protein
VKVWGSDADAIEANAKAIANLRGELKTAEAQQRALRQNWTVSTGHVLSTATVLCNGSPERVAGLALDVETRARLGTLGAVASIAVQPGKASGEVTASWPRGNAHHGFVVQHATDPATPATVSPQIPWTKTRFTLSGLATNATVSFRVAPIDPTAASGIGPWTAWVAGSAK